jgi:hypothetical protein
LGDVALAFFFRERRIGDKPVVPEVSDVNGRIVLAGIRERGDVDSPRRGPDRA